MATAAMFIALGGTSYAAVKITGAEVRDGSLTGRDVRNSSLSGRDVRNGSLRAADIARGQIPSGPRGPQGVAGPTGGKGDKGDPGPGGRWLLISETGSIEQQSGGFTAISKPGINGQPTSNPNVYVDTGATLVGKGLSASTAIQNRLDRDGNGAADPAFAGDAASAAATRPRSPARPPARTRTTRSSCARSPTTPTSRPRRDASGCRSPADASLPRIIRLGHRGRAVRAGRRRRRLPGSLARRAAWRCGW